MPIGGFINTTGSEQTAVQEETKKRAATRSRVQCFYKEEQAPQIEHKTLIHCSPVGWKWHHQIWSDNKPKTQQLQNATQKQKKEEKQKIRNKRDEKAPTFHIKQ